MGWETTDPRGVCDGYLKCSVKADHQGFWSVSDPSWRYKELVVILMILITQLTLSNNKFIFRIGCRGTRVHISRDVGVWFCPSEIISSIRRNRDESIRETSSSYSIPGSTTRWITGRGHSPISPVFVVATKVPPGKLRMRLPVDTVGHIHIKRELTASNRASTHHHLSLFLTTA